MLPALDVVKVKKLIILMKDYPGSFTAIIK